MKKAEQVTSKGDFPELGDESKKQSLSKASIGGPIGQVSAPAKGARTANQFDGFNEEERRRPPAAVEEQKSDVPKERPKFTGGLKGLLSRQNNDNAEANKNLPELQKKLQEQIIIHEAKPPRKEDGFVGVAGEERKHEERKPEDRPPRTFADKK